MVYIKNTSRVDSTFKMTTYSAGFYLKLLVYCYLLAPDLKVMIKMNEINKVYKRVLCVLLGDGYAIYTGYYDVILNVMM